MVFEKGLSFAAFIPHVLIGSYVSGICFNQLISSYIFFILFYLCFTLVVFDKILIINVLQAFPSLIKKDSQLEIGTDPKKFFREDINKNDKISNIFEKYFFIILQILF